MKEGQVLQGYEKYGVCPHCGVNKEWKWKALFNYKEFDEYTKILESFINNQEFYLRILQFSGMNASLDSLSEEIKEYIGKTCENYIQAYYTYCTACHRSILAGRNSKIVYPSVLINIKESENLKDYPKVQTLFHESIAVTPHSPRAGLALGRMALEALVTDILETEDIQINANMNLYNKIEKLKEKDFITGKQKERMHQIRNIGNASVHDCSLIDSDEDITIEDVELVWGSMNMILDNIRNDTYLMDRAENLKERK